MKFLRAISRFGFGLLFIFSGFLKSIDPIGSALKVKEYLDAFHFGWIDFISIPSAMILSAAEFIVGVAILKGLRMQLFSKIALGFISFFTLLTLVIYIFNPVSDCGCFGEAIKLSNAATFYKNLVLLAFALVIYFQRDKFKPIATPRIEWGYILIYAVIIVGIEGYSLKKMPQIDFGIYKPGTDLIATQQGNQEREYETTFIYSKDGKEETFTLNNLPDSTWTFVDAKTILVSGASEDSSVDFSFLDSEGMPVGNEILQNGGEIFFLSIYNARALSERGVERIIRFAERLFARNLKLYILSANSVDDTEELFKPYEELQGIEYEILYADYKAIISFNRSSGGLTYVNNGVIVKKWARGNYPFDTIDDILDKDPEIITSKEQIAEHLFAEISLFIILFLIVIIRFISKIIHNRRVAKLLHIPQVDEREAATGEEDKKEEAEEK